MSMKKVAGFTLTEVMITVGIVSILGAIAFPSYQQHVRKSRRAQAEADLVELAQFMERNFTIAGRYDKNSAGTAISKSSFSFNVSPRGATSTKIMYNIDVSSLAASTFTLTATRNSTSPQASDSCGDLSLTQAGTKSVANNATGYDAATCWGQ